MSPPHPGPPALTLRPGAPDFLDLPWDLPLDAWVDRCTRLEQVVRGHSRHTVVFVNYDGRLFAIKELPEHIAEKEYNLLRQMEHTRLPVVRPAGHARVHRSDGEVSVLITRYLDRCLPYEALFMRSGLARYRDHLLDALAGLLVQLHLAGVFWGDCSLGNTLYRRDAGMLSAYLVDAETSEIHHVLSSTMRDHDLDIMQENLYGGLADLTALGALPEGFPNLETVEYVRQRYHSLWDEVTREEVIPAGERFRIQERIRRLNELGFSVDQVELRPVRNGEEVRLRAFVADRSFHRNLLFSMTGLDVEERQARQLINDIEQVRAALSSERARSVPLSAASHAWLETLYVPIMRRLRASLPDMGDGAEAYCQILEHKWYLSERARRDVGHRATMDDFLRRFAPSAPAEDADEQLGGA